MKNIIVFLALFLVNIPSSFALNPADYLNPIPKEFKSWCYEFYTKIPRSSFEKYKTYTLKTNKPNIVITQFGFILPYKSFWTEKKYYNYLTDLTDNTESLVDDNRNTTIHYDVENKSNIILIELEQELQAGSFKFHFDYLSKLFFTSYWISSDWINYSTVSKSDLSDFSFKYLKIDFWHKNDENIRELISISELNFEILNNTYLIKPFYNDDIEIYSKNNCNNNVSTKAKQYDDFPISNDTPLLEVMLEKNPKYNVYLKSDIDNDWVEDMIDNCKTRYNPNQLDTNSNWIWDTCDDDDKDWLIWYYDNCPYINNRDQTDVNRNWVWDICEFDKDKDWIFDSLDICINIANPDQEDQDKDGIWNECDNCKYYNPSQRDVDENWIWDICDTKRKELSKNDNDLDWIHNNKDNCKDIANPDQIDNDLDWIWNSCDNCQNIQNKYQLDLNKNWTWDMCEDSDWDSIIWYKDNCINSKNKDQLDSDNNWVWNVCEDTDYDKILFINDNCPYDYNPEQKDIDKDSIWDICDEKDDRFIESNKWFFIWLLIFITFIFSYGIYAMIRKLK